MCALQALKITGYTDANFKKTFNGDPYSAMINPESVRWQRSIDYNEEQAPDSQTPSQKFKSTPGEQLDFELVIDCTGIVDPKRTSMSKEINALKKIVFSYNGSIHRPNFVKIQWGNGLLFKGVLTTFSTNYTLFRRDGSPLRAKISLGFKEYISPSTAEKLAGKKSPDVTHQVTVQDGDSLPQLCYEVWQDDSWYIQVARFNHLNKFRNLRGIHKLIFPPIHQTA